MCSGLLEFTLRIGTDKQHGNEYKHVHGEIFSLDYTKLDYKKRVYRGKKLAAQKSRVKYLSFQGGDSRPHSTVVCIQHCAMYRPRPLLDPTDLSPTGHHLPEGQNLTQGCVVQFGICSNRAVPGRGSQGASRGSLPMLAQPAALAVTSAANSSFSSSLVCI